MSTCSVAPLSPRALSLLLHNKWVAVLGDSVARLFCAALLRLGGEHSVEQPVLDRHRSFEYRLAARGSHLSFVWAPYAENITAALASWRQDGHVPDVIVMGSSLWHMLHVRNVTHYAASLAGIRVTLDALLASERRMPIAPFWMTTTALVGHKLNTPEKQAHLTPGQVDAYDAAAAALLTPALPDLVLTSASNVQRTLFGYIHTTPFSFSPRRACQRLSTGWLRSPRWRTSWAVWAVSPRMAVVGCLRGRETKGARPAGVCAWPGRGGSPGHERGTLAGNDR